MKKSNGFTVLELIFIIILLGVASVFFFVQKNSIEVASRDEQRKIAINAIYYSLEEVFYKQYNYYPQTINKDVLISIDPSLFTDPDGVKLGKLQTVNGVTTQPDYYYEPINCSTDGKCKSYTLRALLENEDDFVKDSRHK
jgi:type II secretory pathway pseudopilin PulG